MRSLFLFAIALFVITVPYSFAGSSATTYYVSPSGSDSNPGSASAPWQTIARVNRASLAAGDTVLFQGGQTFSDASLTPPTSGTASAPGSLWLLRHRPGEVHREQQRRLAPARAATTSSSTTST